MSYLHCPTCQRAYNVATQPACPSCGLRPGTPADPTEDIVVAAEQLARAIARATPDQLAAAGSTLDRAARSDQAGVAGSGDHALTGGDRLALTAGALGSGPSNGRALTAGALEVNPPASSRATRGAAILHAVRVALAPPPPSPSAHQALLTTIALALLTRLAPPRAARTVVTWSTRARALLARW